MIRVNNRRYDIQDLLYLMARLRDPETGCPWDLQQDSRSLVPFLLEEAYEVADTIERTHETLQKSGPREKALSIM